MAAAETGHCTTKGCWYYNTDFKSHNSSSGTFGWGTKVLGLVSMDAYHNLNGAQMSTTSTFHTSTALKNLGTSGDLLHGSHTGPGESGDQYDAKEKVSLVADGYWSAWPKVGPFKTVDKSYLNHANVMEYAWEKSGYPGYWYMFQKSLIADDPNNNNIYGFNNDDYMFTNSANSGYHAP